MFSVEHSFHLKKKRGALGIKLKIKGALGIYLEAKGAPGRKSLGNTGVHERNGIGEQNLEGRMLLEFCHQKDLCVANTWFNKEKRKMTYRIGGIHLRMGFLRFANNFVEKENEGGNKEAHGNGMEKCKK